MRELKTLTINGVTYKATNTVPTDSVTLLATAWKGEDEVYSQVVEIPGVTANTKIDLQPTSEQLAEFHYKVLAFVAENDVGVVTVYSIGDKPKGDHTIQITKTEVEGTGKIRGNTVGTTMPRPDWGQTDPTKADYIRNKPAVVQYTAQTLTGEQKVQSRTNIGAASEDELLVERFRINQLVALEDGSTTGDAELQDIRVGYNGTVYETAGEAIRAQVGGLHTKVDKVTESLVYSEAHTAEGTSIDVKNAVSIDEAYVTVQESEIKNLLPNNASTVTQKGIAFTVQSDGSVKVSGTATEYTLFTLYDGAFDAGNTLYYLTGCPEGGSNTSYNLRVDYKAPDGAWAATRRDIGGGASFKMAAEAYTSSHFIAAIEVFAGAVIDNVVFYPMLTTTPDAPYVPYGQSIGADVKITVRNNATGETETVAMNPDGSVGAIPIYDDMTLSVSNEGVLHLVYSTVGSFVVEVIEQLQKENEQQNKQLAELQNLSCDVSALSDELEQVSADVTEKMESVMGINNVPETVTIAPTFTDGFIDTAGTITAHVAFRYTQKIPVKAGDVITGSYTNTTDAWKKWRFLCAYNGDVVVADKGAENVSQYEVPDGVDGIVITIQYAYVTLTEIIKQTTVEEVVVKGIEEKADGKGITFHASADRLDVEHKDGCFSVYGVRNYYYTPQAQPDILGGADSFGNIEWTSDEIINNIYEPLRTANPRYITRENLGKDASGQYDLWCYYFTPENYEYTVYLQGGVHGYPERHGLWGLARIMHMIATAEDNHDGIEELRRKVRFIVVPIVNPWSVSTKDTSYSNYNGVNLNRDCLSAAPQVETSLVMGVMNRFKDEIDFGFDFHTNAGGIEWSYGGYLLVYPHSAPEFWGNRLKRINNFLYYKNLDGTGYRKAFMGENIDYPANSKIDVNADPNYERGTDHESTFASVMWSKYGFPGASLEHGDLQLSTTMGSSTEMTVAVELFMNHLLEELKCHFKLEKKLWNIENA